MQTGDRNTGLKDAELWEVEEMTREITGRLKKVYEGFREAEKLLRETTEWLSVLEKQLQELAGR
jgi:hypothetical protein